MEREKAPFRAASSLQPGHGLLGKATLATQPQSVVQNRKGVHWPKKTRAACSLSLSAHNHSCERVAKASGIHHSHTHKKQILQGSLCPAWSQGVKPAAQRKFWPSQPSVTVSPRVGLEASLHVNRKEEGGGGKSRLAEALALLLLLLGQISETYVCLGRGAGNWEVGKASP